MAPKIATRSKRAGAQTSRENARKRPSSHVQDSSTNSHNKKCKSISDALLGVKELSPKLREMISGLVSHSLTLDADLPAPYRQAALSMVDEAFTSTKKTLESELLVARRKYEGAQEDLAACEAAATDAEARLIDLKSLVDESKTAIKEYNKSIGSSHHCFKSLQAAQKTSQVKMDAIAAKVDRLRIVEARSFQPFKETAAQGREGNKQLQCIQKLGRDLGFHETLLESIPAVLKKELDKRRTFDGFVMEQFEREFMKHCATINGKLKESEVELKEHEAAMQEAQNDAVEKGHTRDLCSKALTEALCAIAPSKKVLTLARQNARKFASDVKKFERNLEQAQARLEAFQTGAFAAFEELRGLASESSAASLIDTMQQHSPASRQDMNY